MVAKFFVEVNFLQISSTNAQQVTVRTVGPVEHEYTARMNGLVEYGYTVRTIGPVEHEVSPRPIHELGTVIRVQGRVVEPAHALHAHSQTAYKRHTYNYTRGAENK